MLWKYRILLNDLKKEDKEEKYYDHFENKNIDTDNKDEEIKRIKNELINLDKLKIYWGDNIINNYKEKLNALILIISSYLNRDKEKPEVVKLRKDCKNLLIMLEKKVKNKKGYEKSLDNLKEEIIDFINLKEPKPEEYENIKKKVKIFMNLIKQKNIDNLNLPNKNDIIKIIDITKYKLYELIFWYSFIEENLMELMNSKTADESYWKIEMSLNEYNELYPIMTFISEKKSKISIENPEFFVEDISKAKQMLRGILLYKIKNNKINLDDFRQMVEALNGKINNPDKIQYDEYMFSYIISEK